MRKIIAIGESVLDTLFVNAAPTKAFVGGRIANAAASLGELGLPVSMVSECCTDAVGDIVMQFYEKHHVDVKSVDRFTDGATPFSAILTGDQPTRIVNYGKYPEDRFDVVWPRIDEDDIVIFGSLYAIDVPQRERLFEMISYAAERKAILIYLPGFQHGINFRITKVMPAILENLEIADLVLALQSDINTIFPDETPEEAFMNHIGFYNNTYFHLNPDFSLNLFGRNRRQSFPAEGATTNLLGWQAGFTAGLVYHIMVRNLLRSDLHQADDNMLAALVAEARVFAQCCAQSPDNCISAQFAAGKRAALEQAEKLREQAAQK